MKRVLMVLALLAATCPAAHAGTELRNRVFIGGGYGATWPEAPKGFRTGYEDGEPVWTGYAGYGLTQDAALRLSYSNMKIDAKNGNGDLLLQPIILGLKLHLLHDTDVNPYVLLGAGLSSNRLRDGLGRETTWSDFAAQGGLGIEFFIGKNFSLAGEGRYDYIEPKSSGAAFQAVSALGVANIYFGTEDRTNTKHEAAAPPATQQQVIVVKDDDDRAERQRAEEERRRLETERAAAAAQLAAQQAVAASSATVAASSAAVSQAQAQVDTLKQKMERREVPPIVFDTNSDRLIAGSGATLDQVAQIANQYPQLKLRVEGHTDNVGDDQKNLQLSQRRADAVKSYLGNKGVDLNRITAVGYGESQPVQSNDTATGRDKNRRVEFKFEQ